MTFDFESGLDTHVVVQIPDCARRLLRCAVGNVMWLVSSLDAATAWTKMNAWLAATKSRPAALCGQILAQWSWVRFHWDFYDLSRWHYVAMVYSWSDMWPFLRKSKRLILLEDAMTRSPATSLPIASPYPSGPLKWPVPPRTASWLRLGSAWKLPSSVRDLFFGGCTDPNRAT